jgi:hypothetical protein
MPDIYPDFPYKWVSWSDWLSRVDTMVDDRLAARTVSATRGWDRFGATVTTKVGLHAGDNVIRLAKGAPHFAGGTGLAELDYIDLT